LEVFSFYYKRKNAEVDDYLKSFTPTFILEPSFHYKRKNVEVDD
jgi:hypothetical protein